MTAETAREQILKGPRWLEENARCRRNVAPGSVCRVIKLDKTRSKALIQDGGRSWWVSFFTLAMDWEHV